MFLLYTVNSLLFSFGRFLLIANFVADDIILWILCMIDLFKMCFIIFSGCIFMRRNIIIHEIEQPQILSIFQHTNNQIRLQTCCVTEFVAIISALLQFHKKEVFLHNFVFIAIYVKTYQSANYML